MEHLISWLSAERGRRVSLAAALKVGPSALSQWQQVPAERCLEVERLTGISRHLLRPDVFGPDPHINEADGLREGDGVARAVSRDDHQDKPAGVAA